MVKAGTLLLVIGLLLVGLLNTKQARAVSPQLKFQISSDQTNYYLHEPLHLTLTLQNQSAQPVNGRFCLHLGIISLELYYRKAGGSFKLYRSGRSNGSPLPFAIEPGQYYSREDIMLFNYAEDEFALNEVGDYEIKAFYRESNNDPDRVYESNLMRIKVSKAIAEDGALKLFSDKEVALLIQNGDADTVESYENALNKSLKLVSKYPGSIYARHIKIAQDARISREAPSSPIMSYEKTLYNALNPTKVNEK